MLYKINPYISQITCSGQGYRTVGGLSQATQSTKPQYNQPVHHHAHTHNGQLRHDKSLWEKIHTTEGKHTCTEDRKGQGFKPGTGGTSSPTSHQYS